MLSGAKKAKGPGFLFPKETIRDPASVFDREYSAALRVGKEYPSGPTAESKSANQQLHG